MITEKNTPPFCQGTQTVADSVEKDLTGLQVRQRKTSEGSELVSSHWKAAEPGLKLALVKHAVSHNSQPQVFSSQVLDFTSLLKFPASHERPVDPFLQSTETPLNSSLPSDVSVQQLNEHIPSPLPGDLYVLFDACPQKRELKEFLHTVPMGFFFPQCLRTQQIFKCLFLAHL